MKLEDWLILMVPDARQAQVAICNSGAYIPDDTCARASDGQESTAASDQLEFLTDEWDRLQELNRNPVQELGDSPPWLSPSGAAVF
jgi:hypothetical protein